MKIAEYKQMMAYLTRPKFNGGGYVKKKVLPKKKPEEEVKKRKLENFEKVKGALENPKEVKEMIDKPKRGLVDEPGKYSQDQKPIGRPPKLTGKTGQIIEALKDLPTGSAVNFEKLSGDLELGKDGTSLIKKIIKNRKELQGKNFRAVTKEEKAIGRINNFIEKYITTNPGSVPTQGEIVKGAKVDPTYLRKYIDEGKVNSVAQTFFDQNKLAAEYILNTEKPTLDGLKKIIGDTAAGVSEKQGRNLVRSAESLATRVYINSLKSLTNKLTKTDEGRSVYKNFSARDVEAIKNKVRQIPGFTSYYEREITDLVADAYKNDEAKKTKALKKIAQFKKINKSLSKKFKVNMVLDHPLSFDFINKAAQGADPEELIRVRPLPERVNAFKTFLDERVPIITEGLKKNPGSKEFISMRDDVMSIADELKIPFPKISNKGTIITPAAAKIGDKPIEQDIRRAGQIQNAFRNFVQRISNDPRIQRLGININKLKDLSKLPNVNLKAYDKAVSDFIKKSGKFGFVVAAPYLAATKGPEFARKLGLVDRDFEQTAAVGEAPITEKPVSLGEKALYGGAGASAAALGTKTGRNILGKAFRILGTPLAGLGFAGTNVYSKMKEGQSLADAVVDPITGLELSFPGLFKENISKIIPERFQGRAARFGRRLLGFGRFGGALTPVGLGLATLGQAQEFYNQKQALKRLKEQNPRAYSEFMESVQTPALSAAEQTAVEDMGRSGAAGGGIMKMAGKPSGPPPESGPTPQGLDFLIKRGR